MAGGLVEDLQLWNLLSLLVQYHQSAGVFFVSVKGFLFVQAYQKQIDFDILLCLEIFLSEITSFIKPHKW